MLVSSMGHIATPKLCVKQAQQRLMKFALTYPKAVLEQPLGHDAVKVKGKMFVTFGGEANLAGEFSLTVKLPISSEMALTLPWVEATGYGLGKSVRVTARQKLSRSLPIAARSWK
ncbi:MAG: hypothetical protein ABL956_05230 [Hyphomonadaceae bacterium]